MISRLRSSLLPALLALLALPGRVLGAEGDMCYLTGVRSSIVDDKLYFMGGNYSIETADGQVMEARATLYHLELNSGFPLESAIPESALHASPIDRDETIAWENAFSEDVNSQQGAIWTIGDTMYFLGGEYVTAISRIAAYNVSTGEWSEVEVGDDRFNSGRRAVAQYATAPEAGLGFILGGVLPTIEGMIRFDASDPANLSWTNETLGSGSNGVEVPNLQGGAMVYIPAGKQGMLVSFGGGNLTAGVYENNGFARTGADWLTVYVYDIESHTWWKQEASGDAPGGYRSSFGTAVSMSPDGSAFHITAYGGWANSRAHEDVYVLSIPSFVWINATETTYETNSEQRANLTNGRNSLGGSCHTYRGSQMVVLGGRVWEGGSEVSGGVCRDEFPPIRVLDLSTYEWREELDTESTYQVPPIIYNEIGGNSTGNAFATVPAAGFADPTFASLLQERVPTATSTPSPDDPANEDQDPESETGESKTNTGAIAGGVVGGVAGLALLITGIWFFLRQKKKKQQQQQHQQSGAVATAGGGGGGGGGGGVSQPHEQKAELGDSGKQGVVAELGAPQHSTRAELPGDRTHVHEMP